MTRPMHVAEYPVDVARNHHVITMPAGARTLSVSGRTGWEGVDLSALVDPSAPMQDRYFLTVQAGDPIANADKLTYVGSFRQGIGARGFHMFEGPRWNVVLKPEIRESFGVETTDVCRAAPDSGSLTPACVALNLNRMAAYYMPTNDDVTCEYCLQDRVRPPGWLTHGAS